MLLFAFSLLLRGIFCVGMPLNRSEVQKIMKYELMLINSKENIFKIEIYIASPA